MMSAKLLNIHEPAIKTNTCYVPYFYTSGLKSNEINNLVARQKNSIQLSELRAKTGIVLNTKNNNVALINLNVRNLSLNK